jgi:hypothetical protein
MHYAEQNSRNLEKVKNFLESMGYTTSIYWIDYLDSTSSLNGSYWLLEDRDGTSKNVAIPSDATRSPAYPKRTAESVQHAFNVWFDNFRQSVLTPVDAKKAQVLTMLERLRELAPDAGLPNDFLNPIEVLAERLRTNIIPATREFDAPPPLSF